VPSPDSGRHFRPFIAIHLHQVDVSARRDQRLGHGQRLMVISYVQRGGDGVKMLLTTPGDPTHRMNSEAFFCLENQDIPELRRNPCHRVEPIAKLMR
jgi:hypothetical protein